MGEGVSVPDRAGYVVWSDLESGIEASWRARGREDVAPQRPPAGQRLRGGPCRGSLYIRVGDPLAGRRWCLWPPAIIALRSFAVAFERVAARAAVATKLHPS
jgi:hypothetical protein